MKWSTSRIKALKSAATIASSSPVDAISDDGINIAFAILNSNLTPRNSSHQSTIDWAACKEDTHFHRPPKGYPPHGALSFRP